MRQMDKEVNNAVNNAYKGNIFVLLILVAHLAAEGIEGIAFGRFHAGAAASVAEAIAILVHMTERQGEALVKFFTANRAIANLTAGDQTSRFNNNNPFASLMGRRLNHRLFFQDCTTNRAFFAVGQAILFAADRFYAGDDFGGVSLCRNDFLSHKDFTADRALDAVGQTIFGASCCLSGDKLFCMSRCRDGRCKLLPFRG